MCDERKPFVYDELYLELFGYVNWLINFLVFTCRFIPVNSLVLTCEIKVAMTNLFFDAVADFAFVCSNLNINSNVFCIFKTFSSRQLIPDFIHVYLFT